jgi:DNA-binding NarL/FixJ family response regulator
MYAGLLGIGLCQQADLEILGIAVGGDAAIEAIVTHQPEIVVVDCRIPGDDSLTIATRIRRQAPDTRIVVITQHRDDPDLQALITTGFASFVETSGDVADIIAGIRALRVRDTPSERNATARFDVLTAREVEVLRHLAQGVSSRQLADQLFVSVNTARNHVQRLLKKLDAHTRQEAVAIAISAGFIEDRRLDFQPALAS